MREVNFSIPNVNKASVHITTTLYDRRALDCTSTLPLINSLNHLAYLTTSSARIRDILTVDGGVERLICILKNGRSNKDMMDIWKWNLAFQCVVNIGVRGSENVRTRVVEADMVPVIATILDNYIQAVERMRAKADAESARQSSSRFGGSTKQAPKLREPSNRSSFFDRSNGNPENRQSRRQAPPPSIEIPLPTSQSEQNAEPSAMDITSTSQISMTSPPERTTFTRPQLHHHHRSHDGRPPSSRRASNLQPLTTAVPTMDVADGFNLRPVRDVDRLPSMLPSLQTGILSQPDSPTTPSAPLHRETASLALRRPRRPSIRQLPSTSGDSDDPNGDESAGSEENGPGQTPAAIVEVQSGVSVQNMEDRDVIMETETTPLALTLPNPSDTQENETFNITVRSAVDGSILTAAATPAGGPIGLSPALTNPAANLTSPLPSQAYPSFTRTLPAPPGILAAMPRDEDVLMSLQLLAYVSKYCNLRTYFQKTHLVPMLKIDRDLKAFEEGSEIDTPVPVGDEMEEYLQLNDFNIFPLVEKFTVRHHSKDMQYWACVVMRNLCRKDDLRGGIRQCAYYECGKWEEFTRQFAKCRRCRRTKYCSKECQKSAWVYHRHWCHAPTPEH